MMTADEIMEKTKNFLSKFIQVENVNPDDDLFAAGLLNSLFAMQLVLFVEKEFNCKVENEDLDLKNFNSINAIVNLIGRKLTA